MVERTLGRDGKGKGFYKKGGKRRGKSERVGEVEGREKGAAVLSLY